MSTEVTKRENADLAACDDAPVYIPATDIYEYEDSIMIVSDMPGVDDKNLDVAIENDVLTVTGKQCDLAPEKHDVLHLGYTPGTYKRSFNILTEIDQDNIKAKLDNGVLTITLPKSEETKPRKIAVEVG